MKKQYQQLLDLVLTASNRGLDIITDVCPAAAEVVNHPKRSSACVVMNVRRRPSCVRRRIVKTAGM